MRRLSEVPTEDSSGDPVSGEGRFRAFSLAQHLLATKRKQLLLFDEVEDVFNSEQKDYQLASGQTYFFYVDMDESGQGTLDQITTESALPLLATKRYQTHQISRVVPNCPTPVIAIPPVTQPAPVVEQPAVLTEKMTIELEVLFDTDKSIVKPDYYSKISEVAEFMAQYPNTLVTIEGHTDSRASEKYNQALSQRRVDAVKEVLITQFGTAPERLNAIGYGELQPRASNNTVEGRQLNRRVIAIIEERPNN